MVKTFFKNLFIIIVEEGSRINSNELLSIDFKSEEGKDLFIQESEFIWNSKLFKKHLSDISFICFSEEKKKKVILFLHREILIQESEYFRALLSSSGMKESTQKELVLSSIKPIVLFMIVQHIYTKTFLPIKKDEWLFYCIFYYELEDINSIQRVTGIELYESASLLLYEPLQKFALKEIYQDCIHNRTSIQEIESWWYHFYSTDPFILDLLACLFISKWNTKTMLELSQKKDILYQQLIDLIYQRLEIIIQEHPLSVKFNFS